MKLLRLALTGTMVLVGLGVALWSAPRGADAATTASGGTGALPLYQFLDTGTEPLPWNAVSLESKISATKMLGGPHGATGASEGVLAYRASDGDLALLSESDTGATQWQDLSAGNDVPAPAADPIPFFDPSGNVDLLYVDTSGDVELLSPNDPITPLWPELHAGRAWRPFVTTDLSALTGVPAAVSLPSVDVDGSSAVVAYRTIANDVEVLTLSWSADSPIPLYDENAYTETGTAVAATPSATSSPKDRPSPRSSATTTTTTTTTTIPKSTTTTTIPKSTTTTTTTTTTTIPATATTPFASDPLVLPGPTPTFATTLSDGDLVVFTSSGSSLSSWTEQNLTSSTGSLPVVGSLSLGTSTSTIDLAALTAGGDVELFTTNYLTLPVGATPYPAVDTWSAANLTGLATGAPPMSGQLSVDVSLTQVAVAGQAAHWGDLFVLTSPVGSSTWTATDVSVTAGSSARTVGTVVTGLEVNGELSLYAAGVSSPPPQGVGVYAIPSSDWSSAITSGWPIISETGGLGTQSAPWVGFTGVTSTQESPDFLMGQAIYNSHKRVTWLSFWTVSGPLAGQSLTTSNYYSHGFDAGAWVATQIDSYRSLGVGIKPDWVILDPEGYPDNHSHLDAPSGASKATLATYATYWSAMLAGWQAGLASVDPALNAAVYASQSEYADYQLSSLSMPVFVALAFADNGPVPVTGASGSNVRGFIAFDASCTPASTLESESATLLNPPWGGQFNTLQFDAGEYCAPPP